MLFVLGLFIVKGPMKWALLAATILSILLSWGKNFMPFTDFFIDYVPMYSKFRTVASILVIAEFTIPLLAMLALKKIVDDPSLLTKRIKAVYASFALTGGIAILFALFPTLFFSDFISSQELRALSTLPQEYVVPITENLREMRRAVFTADCWRSAFIIIIGTLCLLMFKAKKLKASYMVGAITVLCLVDMWQVDKRYLNNDMFVPKSEREAPMQMTETDRLILEDKTDLGNYRVLNLASNTFNENETSYFHNSIGGYHAAKLRRYQDIIDHYIAPEMQKLMPAIAESGGDLLKVNGDSLFPVLNALNARYFIVPLQDGQTGPVVNPHVHGPAWFVDRITYADNANGEIDAVGRIDLRREAVADKRFEDVLKTSVAQDSTASVKLTKYMSDQLEYDVYSKNGGVIVFSEVYYPGWTATVDGQPAELGRADYLLRALNVAPGKHKVVLTFHPKSVTTTETIAYIAYAAIIIAILIAAFLGYRKKKEQAA